MFSTPPALGHFIFATAHVRKLEAKENLARVIALLLQCGCLELHSDRQSQQPALLPKDPAHLPFVHFETGCWVSQTGLESLCEEDDLELLTLSSPLPSAFSKCLFLGLGTEPRVVCTLVTHVLSLKII